MYTNIRWQQRFQNFEKAYFSLNESIEAYENDADNLFIRDSIIQRYEYSIELAWKTLKDYLEEEGFIDVSSPKKVIRQALKEGYITNSTWLKALDDRNKTSHAYDEEMANEVTTEIQEQYFFLLRDLYFTLKKETSDE
jgi:nucleotidyltransferase substrate binding protein (TIGR01987 family)